jgi:hypothetical protein
VFQTAQIDAPLCPKGMAGLVTVYDPYRITRVLKRVGKRGENKWISIPFEQAITEIVEGGLLFKHVLGEENRHVPGLKKLWALCDPELARALAADAEKVAKKQMTIQEFKAKHQANLKYLIDPDHPDFGPLNNQFVFAWGVLKRRAQRADQPVHPRCLRLCQCSRPHHGVPGLALLHGQGDERAVHRGQVDRR